MTQNIEAIKSNVAAIIAGGTIRSVSDSDLIGYIEKLNFEYRGGNPLVSDEEYDHVFIAELVHRNPEHPFLNNVEPESDDEEFLGKKIPLPERMLSTNKAYSSKAIDKWASEVIAAGKSIGLSASEIFIRITPKLDGYAAYDDGAILYTRGNGRQGTDITRAFDRGLKIESSFANDELSRGLGKGEIVVAKDYFKEKLSGVYDNTRNVIAAVIKEGEVDNLISEAINDGAIVFRPFNQIIGLVGNVEDVSSNLGFYWESLIEKSVYDTDGLVLEAITQSIKEVMGSTNHHHKWQVAFKKNTESHDIEVIDNAWQTGKTGRITPVALLTPTIVGGVTVSRATCHHAGNVLAKKIGKGAIVKVYRSGQVIPWIASVVSPSQSDCNIPTECPSCGSEVEWEDDFLVCSNNYNCPAQLENTLIHFFKTIGNCDGFGAKVVQKLVAHGYTTVEKIYNRMELNDLLAAGISTGVAKNLLKSLDGSKRVRLEDWRFLAAFGIHGVGRGGCEKILQIHSIKDVFTITEDQAMLITDIGEKKAKSLVLTLTRIKPDFDNLVDQFCLISSEPVNTTSPITGKSIVFTGTMERGNREDMERQAKLLGAKVSSSVSNKTMLVCGAKPGAGKVKKAVEVNAVVYSESEYLELIGVEAA
ncbi:BRCT domain-containing protein [Methylomonas sp. AM2-LC]|uniref:BRCT domain-containing protein n=1 Tax=Methylomonas sp. AM2-LC TaxID=3153301 RepID=UPI0032666597